MTRVGVVDLGTNSTRLLVADVEDGEIRELDRRLTITRLGEGVDAERRLLPAAVTRVRATLAEYHEAIEAAGAERALAVATSAMRDALNSEAFVAEIGRSYGLETRVLSGDEEALLTFRGVAAGRKVRVGTLVIDVGGGSTELIHGGPAGVAWHASLDVGCVRMTERFLPGDPPAVEELAACAGYVREVLATQTPADIRPVGAIGVAGTVTTLATLALGLRQEESALVHGHVLTSDWIAAELSRLSCATLAELRARPGIEWERAPVLVAGAVVLLETLRHFGLGSLEASEQDLMHGAALEAAAAG